MWTKQNASTGCQSATSELIYKVVSCLGTKSLGSEIFWFDSSSSQQIFIEYLRSIVLELPLGINLLKWLTPKGIEIMGVWVGWWMKNGWIDGWMDG